MKSSMSSKKEAVGKRKENKQSGENDPDLSLPSCSGYMQSPRSSTIMLPKCRKNLPPLPSTSFQHPKSMYDPSTPASGGVRKSKTKINPIINSDGEEESPYDNINMMEFCNIQSSPLYPQIKEMKKKSYWNRKKSIEGITRMSSDEVDLLAFDKSYDDMIRQCIPSDSDEEYNEYLKSSAKKNHKAIHINRSSFTIPDENLLPKYTTAPSSPSYSSDSSFDNKPKTSRNKKSVKNIKRQSKSVKKSGIQKNIEGRLGTTSKKNKMTSQKKKISNSSSFSEVYHSVSSSDDGDSDNFSNKKCKGLSSIDRTSLINKSASGYKNQAKLSKHDSTPSVSENIRDEHSSVKYGSSQNESITSTPKMKNKVNCTVVKVRCSKEAQNTEKKFSSGNKKVKYESLSSKSSFKETKPVSSSKNYGSENFASKDISQMPLSDSEDVLRAFSSKNTPCVIDTISNKIRSSRSKEENVDDSELSDSKNITCERPPSKNVSSNFKSVPAYKLKKSSLKKRAFCAIETSVSSGESTKLEIQPSKTVSCIKGNESASGFKVKSKLLPHEQAVHGKLLRVNLKKIIT